LRRNEDKHTADYAIANPPYELQHRVTYYTTMAGAKAACYALGELDAGDVNCLQDLHKSLN
jgi:hypothetical protein